MNLNGNQVLSIILIVLSVLVASTSQLTDLVGPGMTKTVVSIASLLSAILNGVMAVITGQSSQVKAVLAMPGLDKMVINKNAGAMLATLAVDPAQDKIEASPEASAAVQATARAAS